MGVLGFVQGVPSPSTDREDLVSGWTLPFLKWHREHGDGRPKPTPLGSLGLSKDSDPEPGALEYLSELSNPA